MTATIDFDQPYAKVVGRSPLAYMQDGKGFGVKGDYLGEYDDQGEPKRKKPGPKPKSEAGDSELP